MASGTFTDFDSTRQVRGSDFQNGLARCYFRLPRMMPPGHSPPKKSPR